MQNKNNTALNKSLDLLRSATTQFGLLVVQQTEVTTSKFGYI